MSDKPAMNKPVARDPRPIGAIELPKLDGVEVREGVVLIGEPTPVAGTNKLRCLANVLGSLCMVELRIKFLEKRRAE